MRRTGSCFVIASLVLLAACDGGPPAPLPTYPCTTELSCTTAEACVRHYSSSGAEPDRFECATANECATALVDYCDADAHSATCNAMEVMTDVDAGAPTGAVFASCAYR